MKSILLSLLPILLAVAYLLEYATCGKDRYAGLDSRVGTVYLAAHKGGMTIGFDGIAKSTPIRVVTSSFPATGRFGESNGILGTLPKVMRTNPKNACCIVPNWILLLISLVPLAVVVVRRNSRVPAPSADPVSPVDSASR
jgi:hypothetical protein